jgi:hypothetical protein
MKNNENLVNDKLPPGYQYYQTFDVTLHVTYAKSYKVKAMNDDHALAVARNRIKKRHKSTDAKGLGFVEAVGVKAKRIHEDDNGTS